MSFFHSPVVGFARNLVEIHRSAAPQLSNQFLGGNFDEKPQKIGGENPPKSTRKSFIRTPLYFNNRGVGGGGGQRVFHEIFGGHFGSVLGSFGDHFGEKSAGKPKTKNQEKLFKIALNSLLIE